MNRRDLSQSIQDYTERNTTEILEMRRWDQPSVYWACYGDVEPKDVPRTEHGHAVVFADSEARLKTFKAHRDDTEASLQEELRVDKLDTAQYEARIDWLVRNAPSRLLEPPFVSESKRPAKRPQVRPRDVACHSAALLTGLVLFIVWALHGTPGWLMFPAIALVTWATWHSELCNVRAQREASEGPPPGLSPGQRQERACREPCESPHSHLARNVWTTRPCPSDVIDEAMLPLEMMIAALKPDPGEDVRY